MNHRISRGQFIKLRVHASPVRGISRLIRAFPVPTPILPRICRGSSAYCGFRLSRIGVTMDDSSRSARVWGSGSRAIFRLVEWR